MHDKIQEAFGQIHATDQMKHAVSDYLAQNTYNTEKKPASFQLRPLLAVCALLLICFKFGSWYLWETPISYVSVDVNPSIELALNRMNHVTKANGLNKEGQILLNHVSLKGKNYLNAVELLVRCDAMQPYLTDNADLTITVASSNADQLISGLKESVVTEQYQGMCRRANMDAVESAHKCGMSLGKYQLYQTLSEYDTNITPEECHHMSMYQLHELLLDYETATDPSNNDENSADAATNPPGNDEHSKDTDTEHSFNNDNSKDTDTNHSITNENSYEVEEDCGHHGDHCHKNH